MSRSWSIKKIPYCRGIQTVDPVIISGVGQPPKVFQPHPFRSSLKYLLKFLLLGYIFVLITYHEITASNNSADGIPSIWSPQSTLATLISINMKITSVVRNICTPHWDSLSAHSTGGQEMSRMPETKLLARMGAELCSWALVLHLHQQNIHLLCDTLTTAPLGWYLEGFSSFSALEYFFPPYPEICAP